MRRTSSCSSLEIRGRPRRGRSRNANQWRRTSSRCQRTGVAGENISRPGDRRPMALRTSLSAGSSSRRLTSPRYRYLVPESQDLEIALSIRGVPQDDCVERRADEHINGRVEHERQAIPARACSSSSGSLPTGSESAQRPIGDGLRSRRYFCAPHPFGVPNCGGGRPARRL